MEWTEGYPCTLLKLPESDYTLTEAAGCVKKDFFGSCLKMGFACGTDDKGDGSDMSPWGSGDIQNRPLCHLQCEK